MILRTEDDAKQARISSNKTFIVNFGKHSFRLLQHVKLLASPAHGHRQAVLNYVP